jgi:hypothetical protein
MISINILDDLHKVLLISLEKGLDVTHKNLLDIIRSIRDKALENRNQALASEPIDDYSIPCMPEEVLANIISKLRPEDFRALLIYTKLHST